MHLVDNFACHLKHIVCTCDGSVTACNRSAKFVQQVLCRGYREIEILSCDGGFLSFLDVLLMDEVSGRQYRNHQHCPDHNKTACEPLTSGDQLGYFVETSAVTLSPRWSRFDFIAQFGGIFEP